MPLYSVRNKEITRPNQRIVNRKDREPFFMKAYDDNADAIFRYCFFKLHDRDLAKDTVQEVFLRTWGEIEKDKEFTNVKAFLYTVAGNLIKDHWKKKKAIPISQFETGGYEEEIPFDVADEGPGLMVEAEVKRAVRLFERLSESDREVLSLRFVEGLTPKDIAEILEERENTISVRLNRAVERLRNIVDKESSSEK